VSQSAQSHTYDHYNTWDYPYLVEVHIANCWV